jgi:prepilin-type N-terminal cleavage/methylation domain-containing protein
MKKIEYQIQNTNSDAGFTIAELLIALSVMALLLAAVAVAFNASVINYRENEEIFKTINNARQALCRMTTQLRTGDKVNPNDPNNRCRFFTSEGQDITYEHRSGDNKLYLITNSNGNEYMLCDNVIDATFTKTPDGSGDCKSVQISMTVQSGSLQKTLSAAAVIRKNLK